MTRPMATPVVPRGRCLSSDAMRALFDDDQRQREARRVCHTCPLLVECRATTLRTEAAGNPVYGVAGGLLPSERPHADHTRDRADGLGMRPGRKLAMCGTPSARDRHRRRGEKCPACQPMSVGAE